MARKPEIITTDGFENFGTGSRHSLRPVLRNNQKVFTSATTVSPSESAVYKPNDLSKLVGALEIRRYGDFVDVVVHAERLPDSILRRSHNSIPAPTNIARSAKYSPTLVAPTEHIRSTNPRTVSAPTQSFSNDGHERGGTVFLPSDLVEYKPTSYPWNTIGRVYGSGGGAGTGAFVSSSVVITSNHLVSLIVGGNYLQAIQCPGAGSIAMTFKPADSSHLKAPELDVLGVVRWNHIANAGSISDHQQAFDYAMLYVDLPPKKVFSHPGWMSLAKYNKKWNGNPMWFACGYPGNSKYLPVGFKYGDPVVHQNGTIVDVETKGDELKGLRIAHNMDFLGGMSGGPILGWPPGTGPIPQLVGILATHGSGDVVEVGTSKKWNHASGGNAMLTLLSIALDYFGWSFGTTK